MGFMFNFRDMMLIHFLIGTGIVLFVALRAKNKGHHRRFCDFGAGFLGEQSKWIQWYSWALGAELMSSIFYIHTGMFYFELGMSIIEAIPLTIGAFVVDRLFGFFAGDVEFDIPKPRIPKLDTSRVRAPFNRTASSPKGFVKTQEDIDGEKKAKLDSLTKDC